MQYSPLLAIVTGILELAAGLWTLLDRRSGRIRFLRPVGLIFLFLAGYQFSEVAVCTRPGNKLWTQLAFLDITWLPPLGLWLAARLSEPRNRWLKVAAVVDFGLAAGFSIWILAAPQAITKSVCGMVIARYFPTAAFDLSYAFFYQLSLLVTIVGATAGMALGDALVERKHLANLQIGLLGFLFPALAVRFLVPEAGEGILPSVMCHFAIVLAVSLFMLALRERRSFPS
jgi:hypothetical protein